MPVGEASSGRSPALRAASAVVAVEGAGLVGLALWYAGKSLVDRPDSLARALLAALMALAGGLALLGLARALVRARRWARTPVVVLELLTLPVGVGLLQGHLPGYGGPVVAAGVAALVLLATPGAREPFADR
ncbi:MAG: hypothetical protein M3Z02_04655 [Actinomycetota bacterium]|nr:hypothetical protein [Actinomycetota bacterium]